ncbi:MAG: hypothetical protein GY811_11725 [Myxococcales bacterium]|nr:hypothetical protein [Myxococcales bacterium]
MKTVLITGSGGPLGVNFSRSLRASGEDLRLIGTDANRWHLPLSLCDKTYCIPLAKSREAYKNALSEIAEKESVDILIPTHPVEVRAIAELRDAGALGAMKTALPETAVLDISDDKAKTQAMLQAAGLPVPRTKLLCTDDDVREAFDDLRVGDGPVWVRGAGAPGLGIGGAALPCRSAGVALAWVEHYDGLGRMAASEYLPGSNLSWMALYSHGTLVASGSRERLEYVLPHVSPSGITGAPAVSRTIESPELAALGERAVEAIAPKPHGVFFVDFKGDNEDRPRITEINGGRCGTTIHFYTEAGCNFPHLLTRLASDGALAPLGDPRSCIAPGQYWVRTLDCGPALVRDSDFNGYPCAGMEVT